MKCDIENINQVVNSLVKYEKELKKMSLKEIQSEIKIIEQFLEKLQNKKIELEQEIELYEEDWMGYEREELQEINTSIKKVSNYLDKLYDFESFAE